MMEKTKILVVDDEADLIRKPMVRQLRRAFADAEIMEASNGSEALEMVKAHQPDLVILDLMMPVMNGIDVLNELREQDLLDTTRVVVLTAASDDQVRLQALKMGALDYLDKAIPMDEFNARIQNFMSMATPSHGEKTVAEPEAEPEAEPGPEAEPVSKPKPQSKPIPAPTLVVKPTLEPPLKAKPNPSHVSAPTKKISAGSKIIWSVVLAALSGFIYYGASFFSITPDPKSTKAIILELEAYYEKNTLRKGWIIKDITYVEDKTSWADIGGKIWIDVQINDKNHVSQITDRSFIARANIAKMACPKMSKDLNIMVNANGRIWIRLRSAQEELTASRCP